MLSSVNSSVTSISCIPTDSHAVSDESLSRDGGHTSGTSVLHRTLRVKAITAFFVRYALVCQHRMRESLRRSVLGDFQQMGSLACLNWRNFRLDGYLSSSRCMRLTKKTVFACPVPGWGEGRCGGDRTVPWCPVRQTAIMIFGGSGPAVPLKPCEKPLASGPRDHASWPAFPKLSDRILPQEYLGWPNRNSATLSCPGDGKTLAEDIASDIHRCSSRRVVVSWLGGGQAPENRASTDWPSYGGGAQNTHYSSLAQINRKNVSRLEVAWTFDTGDSYPESEMECSPIVVEGVLYAASPKNNIVALDAATGKLLWRFDPNAGQKIVGKLRNVGSPIGQTRTTGGFSLQRVNICTLEREDGTRHRNLWKTGTRRPARRLGKRSERPGLDDKPGPYL